MTEEVPLKKIRLANRRHPYLRERPRGVWYPEAAAMGIPGYPKTQEAFDKKSAQCREQVIRLNARGISRLGVPNGWGNLKKEAAEERRRALIKAEGIYKEMVDRDMLVDPVIGSIDDQRAESAMIGVIAMAIDVTNTTAIRLKAHETVLSYCKVKPQKSLAIQLGTAEDFLSSLIGSTT